MLQPEPQTQQAQHTGAVLEAVARSLGQYSAAVDSSCSSGGSGGSGGGPFRVAVV